jgi:hypothetical protein
MLEYRTSVLFPSKLLKGGADEEKSYAISSNLHERKNDEK